MKTLSPIFCYTFFAISALNFPLLAQEAPQASSHQVQWIRHVSETPKLWTDDYDFAIKLAKQENKLVFVNFTGTDWCKWCIRLEKDVFSKPEFEKIASQQFILLYIDCPRSKRRLPKKLQTQNDALTKKYQIHGFPSVLILNAEGELIAQTGGYLEGGPKAYLEHINKLIAKGRPLVELRHALKTMPKDASCAKKIDALIRGLSLWELKRNSDLVKILLSIDSDGKLGLREHYPYYAEILPQEEFLTRLEKEIETRLQKELSSTELRNKSAVKIKIATILTPYKAKLSEIVKTGNALSSTLPDDHRAALNQITKTATRYLKLLEGSI